MNETLYDDFKYDMHSIFSIQLFPCKNKGENNNHCKSKEFIDKYLNGAFVYMKLKNIELTPEKLCCSSKIKKS